MTYLLNNLRDQVKKGDRPMRYTIYGKNMHVSDDLKDMLKKKFSKFDRYFQPETEVFVTFSQEKKSQGVEITIPLGQSVLRAEQQSPEILTAIENAIDVIEGQLRKHKTKIQRHYSEDVKKINYEEFDEIDDEEIDDDEPNIVRWKKFPIKPMSIEEAILQMDMLGHSFFVFLNAETDETNVVYKRKDGNYGIIEPI